MILVQVIHFLAMLAATGVVVMVLVSERRSTAKWLFVAGMAALAVEALFGALAVHAPAPDGTRYWQNWRMFATSLLPGIWLSFSLTFARGDYQSSLVRWRWVLAAAFVCPIILALGSAGDLINLPIHSNSGEWIYSLSVSAKELHLLLLIACVLILMNLERTFRAAVGTMRWRIKYMMIGLFVLFAVRIYTASQAVLSTPAPLEMQTVSSVALLLACGLILRWVPRSREHEVAVYPSQSVLQHSVTVLLVGIYLMIVGVAARLTTRYGGDTAFAIKAFGVLISLVLLTMVLLSDRVRMQTRRFVSRHFQRPLHDYRTVWRAFTEGTASRVQEQELCEAVVKLLADIFQVLSVTLWTVDPRGERFVFGASSSFSDVESADRGPQSEAAAPVIQALRGHPDPVDIDAGKETWVETVRGWHRSEFRAGGHRVCVPMIAGGDLMGIILIGDRVAGVPFSTQDFDLLRCVGDQVAAGLLNIRLSRRLVEAKEMEAFQTMSAFFVHDLKNTASTLSLMLQNLPVHYNDPAFREDALRGIAKAARHIDDLILRLTQLRHQPAPGPMQADLNRVVADVLATLDLSPSVRMVQELTPLPQQPLDPGQIQKVVTNLVINAREALRGEGEIRVRTGQQNGWAVLSVSDTGVGMSREFVERSLFRPFQTTKKQGIGIGMFQSKMIVEAHRGKIEVETAPGKGTTFRVLLPLKPDTHETEAAGS